MNNIYVIVETISDIEYDYLIAIIGANVFYLST